MVAYPYYKRNKPNNEKMKKYILICWLMLTAVKLSAQQLAVGTDVLKDALMIPNLGIELGLGKSHLAERTVLGLHGYVAHNPWGNKVKAWGIQPELRYYISGRAMSRWFVGAGAHLANYDIVWSSKVYKGNSVGAGFIFGYVFNVTQRLNIDVHSGFGLVVYRHKEYYDGDFFETDYNNGQTATPNSRGYTTLPTRLGVSLTYILK